MEDSRHASREPSRHEERAPTLQLILRPRKTALGTLIRSLPLPSDTSGDHSRHCRCIHFISVPLSLMARCCSGPRSRNCLPPPFWHSQHLHRCREASCIREAPVLCTGKLSNMQSSCPNQEYARLSKAAGTVQHTWTQSWVTPGCLRQGKKCFFCHMGCLKGLT